MRTRKLVVVSVALGTLAVGLAACGGGEGQDQPGATTSPTTGTPSPTDSPSPTEPPQPKGKRIESGGASAVVPKGWAVVEGVSVRGISTIIRPAKGTVPASGSINLATTLTNPGDDLDDVVDTIRGFNDDTELIRLDDVEIDGRQVVVLEQPDGLDETDDPERQVVYGSVYDEIIQILDIRISDDPATPEDERTSPEADYLFESVPASWQLR